MSYESPAQLDAERKRRREARIAVLTRERDQRIDNLIARNPRLGEILRQMRAASDEVGKLTVNAMLHGGLGNYVESLAKIRAVHAALKGERDNILAVLGATEHDLEIWWDCPTCQNTGYTPTVIDADGKFSPSVKCECLRTEEVEDMLKAAGLTGPLRSQTFDSWDPLRVPVSDRKRMVGLAEFCKTYARDVANGKANRGVLLMGDVGRGKTHLAAAIANAVASQRKAAAYFPATKYTEFIRSLRMSDDDRMENLDKIQRLLDLPLIVLDDFGTERETPLFMEEIFNLLNHRVGAGLPLVISTNLTVREIDERYGDRIYSRLFGFCDVCEARGVDNRLHDIRRKDEGEATT